MFSRLTSLKMLPSFENNVTLNLDYKHAVVADERSSKYLSFKIMKVNAVIVVTDVVSQIM